MNGINNERNYFGLGFLLCAGALIGLRSYSGESKRIEQPQLEQSENRLIKNIQDNAFREGPVYSDSIVPPNMCSRYVRLAAKDIFGIEYPGADAWDIRSDMRIDEIPVRGKDDLEDLAKKGILKPGMILGLYYPNSNYNEKAKKAGAGYTHVSLFIGIEDKELFFADKFGKITRKKVSINNLLKKGNLQPREILFVK